MSKLDRFLEKNGKWVKAAIIVIGLLLVLFVFFLMWKYSATDLMIKK